MFRIVYERIYEMVQQYRKGKWNINDQFLTNCLKIFADLMLLTYIVMLLYYLNIQINITRMIILWIIFTLWIFHWWLKIQQAHWVFTIPLSEEKCCQWYGWGEHTYVGYDFPLWLGEKDYTYHLQICSNIYVKWHEMWKDYI